LLLVALKSVANARGIVDSAGREALIAKVRALIPEQERATASAWADNVGVPGKATAQPEPRHLEALLTALGDNRWVEVEYSSARRDSTQSLRPEKLYLEEGFWYLRAFSAQHRAVRTYRADRMKKVAPLDRAPNYAIADAPPAYGDPSLPEVVIALTRPGAKEASRSFPYLEVLEEQDGPRLRVRCPPHEYPWYARAVLGMAGEARALEPAPFVTCVAELAREIARIHEKR
jgi:proteasome accessory factor C